MINDIDEMTERRATSMDDFERVEDLMNQTDENRLNDFGDTLAELAEHIYGPEVAEFIRSHAPYRMKEKRSAKNDYQS